MELFRNTNINFLKYRRFWIGVSALVLALGALEVIVRPQLNLGIDFAGGHQVTVLLRQTRPVEEIRRVLADRQISAQVQTMGEDGRELLIRAPLTGAGEGETATPLIEALGRAYGAQGGALDLNRAGATEVGRLLFERDPDQLVGKGDDAAAAEHYEAAAREVLAERRTAGLFASWEEVEQAVASPDILQALRDGAALGDLAVLGQESVGPQVGSELRLKALWAVVLSLAGMLGYIWIRFELRYAVGAIMASIHDVLVTFGLYAIAGFEINLTTVAAFLTLVGYSVNDTVVVFDRMRENLQHTPNAPLAEVMNRSLNQTLSRTVLTSGTTLLAAGSLLALGGDVLRGFSFVLTVGVVVGTYSSVYIASSFALLWEELRSSRRSRKGGAPRPQANSGGGGRLKPAG